MNPTEPRSLPLCNKDGPPQVAHNVLARPSGAIRTALTTHISTSGCSRLKLYSPPLSLPRPPQNHHYGSMHSCALSPAPQNASGLCRPGSRATSALRRCLLQHRPTSLRQFPSPSICCWNKTAQTGGYKQQTLPPHTSGTVPPAPRRSHRRPYAPHSLPPQERPARQASAPSQRSASVCPHLFPRRLWKRTPGAPPPLPTHHCPGWPHACFTALPLRPTPHRPQATRGRVLFIRSQQLNIHRMKKLRQLRINPRSPRGVRAHARDRHRAP